MQIAANTKIATLIKANPATIDAIASINKHFEKLRNPVLRKILASRVTIADAARMGGCEVERFYEKLLPLGFQLSENALSKPLQTNTPTAMPATLVSLLNNLVTLDVREDIASGNDPFRKIMLAIEKLGKGKAMLIINTFEPTPLIAILKKKGFDAFSQTESADLVYTYFWAGEQQTEAVPEQRPENEHNFDTLLLTFAGNMKKIDVRQLEMPQPMITILQELEQLPEEKALFVNHKRVPQYLLPQIEERGFQIAINEVGPGNVFLLIYK